MRKILLMIIASAMVITFGVSFPVKAAAADQELLQKIEQLTRELEMLKQQVLKNEEKTKDIETLKQQVQKNEEKSKDIDALKQQVKKTEEKSLGRWLEIGGDYRFRYDNLRGEVAPYADGMTIFSNAGTLMSAMQAGTIPPMSQQALFGAAVMGGTVGSVSIPSARRDSYDVKSDSLYTNRFGLDMKAKATQNVSVTARFLMYKVWGDQDDSALRTGSTAYSLDRAGIFDGTVGHVPGDSKLAVDRVYATWTNIADQPLWFSVGRRPSTGGMPSNLRENKEASHTSGVPSILVDYAFDGLTIGYAPEIAVLPGAYVKFCYGRGYQSDIEHEDSLNSLHNTDMIGINIVPYDTDRFRAELQYNRGMNIFDAPTMLTGPFTLTTTDNLGNIDWYGLSMLGKVKNVGIGNLNWFVNGAISRTDPNGSTLKFNGMNTGYGLLFTGTPENQTGWAVYAGVRYDIPSTGTKIGLEYNHGSENWITFTPAADDMWTSKLGTRGNVYEFYVIQELKLKPVSSYLSKTFFRIGYQYYDFDYTGSNSWLGAPVKIGDLNSMTPQLTAPLKNAHDLYATFEVHF